MPEETKFSNVNQKQTNIPINKKAVILAVLVLVLIAAVALLYYFNLPKNSPLGTNLETKETQEKSKQIIIGQRQYFDPATQYAPLPLGLPLDKPLDVTINSQVKITYPSDPFSDRPAQTQESGQSLVSAMDPQGKATVTITQPNPQAAPVEDKPVVYNESTFTYITNVSLENSVVAYRKYLKNNGWIIKIDNGTDQVHSLEALKQEISLKYIYSINASDDQRYITLIYSVPELSAEEQAFIKELEKAKK